MATKYTNADTNMTTSSGLTPGQQVYYNRVLLRTFPPNLVHVQFGKQENLPMNAGKSMNLRKITPFEADTTPLGEGNSGESEMIVETEVTMNIDQYGKYIRTTDLLDMTHLDMNIQRKLTLMGEQGALSMDAVVREEIAKGTNVLYSGGKLSRETLTKADVLTSKDLRRAVVVLEDAHAPKFDGWYIAIVSPHTRYDLQDDKAWEAVATYQNKESVYTGEIGRLFGVRVVVTTEAKVFKKGGADSIDVASTAVIGQEAYGVVSLKSAKPRSIIKQRGSAGTADPLDQLSSVGWKQDGFGAKILQQEYLVRIESGMSF